MLLKNILNIVIIHEASSSRKTESDELDSHFLIYPSRVRLGFLQSPPPSSFHSMEPYMLFLVNTIGPRSCTLCTDSSGDQGTPWKTLFLTWGSINDIKEDSDSSR